MVFLPNSAKINSACFCQCEAEFTHEETTIKGRTIKPVKKFSPWLTRTRFSLSIESGIQNAHSHTRLVRKLHAVISLVMNIEIADVHFNEERS